MWMAHHPAVRLDVPWDQHKERRGNDERHWVVLEWAHRKTVCDFIKYKNRCLFTFFTKGNPAFPAGSCRGVQGKQGPKLSVPNNRGEINPPLGNVMFLSQMQQREET